ncbi:putative acetylesterase [Colletotrichum asianum]
MKFAMVASVLLAAANFGAATVLSERATKPPYFILIGDSTVTANAGWGTGFLDYLTGDAKGENRAKSGTSTSSWQSNGRWKDLLETIEEVKEEYRPIVPMQFGHNDQKYLSLDEYRAYIVQMVTDIQDAGGKAIVITPLTRRLFIDGNVREDFVEWRGKAIAAAKDAGAYYLDLTLASTNYVNAIGQENAQNYNYGDAGTDRTHLNSAGSKVFGRMVLDLLLQKRSDLSEYFTSNDALSALIAAGEFATGDE